MLFFFIVGCTKENSIINDPQTNISSFVPHELSGIKIDKIEYLSNNDQGFIQKGLIYFTVIGKETISKQIDNQLQVMKTPIILNVFVCNKETAIACEEYLSNGILQNNEGLIHKEVSISNKRIYYFEFQERGSLTEQNAGTVNSDSTTYLWCESKYCFQILSYYQFEEDTRTLVKGVINTYAK